MGFAPESGPADRLLPPLRRLTEGLADSLRADYPAVTLRWTGETALNVDLRRTSSMDVGSAERRALPLTALVLLVAFGALAAALIPVLAGALAIAITLGAAAIVATVWPLSILLQSLVTMLGLGLGIDYALLMVSRFREGLAIGNPPADAAEDAARHAGHTILLSAATVALGFTALLVVPLNEMRAIAVGGLLVVIVSALLATTLLPGVLAALGHRVDWGRLRRRSTPRAGAEAWRRWGRWVTARPWSALVLGALPLVLLATQAPRLRPGLPRGQWLPSSMESVRALEDLHTMGRRGVVQSLRVVVLFSESPHRAGEWKALARFAGALSGDPRIERVRSIFAVAEAAKLDWFEIVTLPPELARIPRAWAGERGWPNGAARSRAARRRHARAGRRPGPGTSRERRVAHRGGRRASAGRRPARVQRRLPGRRLGALLGDRRADRRRYPARSFLGFRSILVPLKAVALNLLTVAAAFGALVLVFQEGHGGRLFGVAEPLGAAFSSLPVIVFSIVFGLSMDYEVFLMNRVRETRLAGAGIATPSWRRSERRDR